MTSDTTLVDASLFPRLIVRVRGRTIEEVDLKGDLSIGRAEDNDLQLADPKASRHHARLRREGATFVLIDLDSANGTRVNGLRITESHVLRHGERIGIGDTELTYEEPGQAAQDTITMEGVPIPVQQATAARPARRVPPPPTRPESGPSRGLTVGLVLVAAVVLLAIVAIAIYFLAPNIYERIGLISPPTSTPAEVIASPTVSTPAGTPVVPADGTPEVTVPPGSAIDLQEMDDLLTQADALTRRSKFEEAITIYEDLVSRAPDDSRPEVGWAWVLILDMMAADALPHAQRAVDLDAESAPAAAVLGRVYVDLGDRQQSLTWAQKAVDLDSTRARARAVLAEAYMLNGESQKAVEEADLALVQDINNAEAHRVRGWLYHIVDNDMGRAANELQIAAGLQPELWLRRHELGVLLLEAEDYITAIMAFQDALGIRPKAVTYTAIGEAYYQLGQYDQARASLQQAVSSGADDAHTYALMAATAARRGDCDEAETYYEQALGQEPNNALALEAKELCESEEPSPTPSATTASAAQSTPSATVAATTPEATKQSSTPASLAGRIAFPVWSNERSKYDVYVANIDGSGRRLVAEEMHQPAFSPDGSWLAINGERHEHMNLFVVKPDGTGLKEISQHLEDELPSWSPDGKDIVFSSRMHGDKQSRVYIIDEVTLVGSYKAEGRPLNFGPDDVRGDYPAWTADGQIAYSGCDLTVEPAKCGLYIIPATPGAHPFKQLTEHQEDTAPAAYGSKITFMSNRDGNWEIYVINNNGSGLQRLTNNAANDGLPTWSPDGKSIAFVSDQGGGWAMWAMNADGSNRRKLFAIGAGGLAFDWQHERISWAP